MRNRMNGASRQPKLTGCNHPPIDLNHLPVVMRMTSLEDGVTHVTINPTFLEGGSRYVLLDCPGCINRPEQFTPNTAI